MPRKEAKSKGRDSKNVNFKNPRARVIDQKKDQESDDDAVSTSDDSPSDSDESACHECGQLVQENDQGILCEACDFWYHRSCATISEETYKFLENAEEGISWYCKDCSIRKGQLHVQEQKSTKRNEKKMDRILAFMDKIEDKLSDIDKMIEKKIDNKLETKIEAGVEKALYQHGLLSKCSKINALGTDSEIKTTTDDSKSCGRQPQMSTIDKHQTEHEEREDRKRRERNIIVFGIPEDINKENLKQDTNRVGEVIEEVTKDCQNVRIESICRLGRKGNKPRPLRATLKTYDEKRTVLVNARRLRQANKTYLQKVYIAADLTPLQRERDRQLRREVKDRKDKGEDCVIYRGRVVQRQTPLDRQSEEDEVNTSWD